jgi:hypothetical protein
VIATAGRPFQCLVPAPRRLRLDARNSHRFDSLIPIARILDAIGRRSRAPPG